MALSAGTRLGPYEILAPLGAGGMGEVYRARDSRLGRDVAVKILPEERSTDPSRLRRFEAEARTVASLNHPHILAVYDVGTHDGLPYAVTELLEGETLCEVVGRGPLPSSKVVEYGVQICRGLAAAHEHGIVHRDLKPGNLFLTRDGQIKILDFGLAKPGGASQTSGPLDTHDRTATDPGLVMGTSGYMSPEQARGLPADARSDVFSLGAVFYEMASGRHAFKKDSPAETLAAILNEDPAALVSSGVSPGLERIVRRCLEKDPRDRFQSAHDLALALEAASDRVPLVRAPIPTGRLWIWAPALVALAVIAGLWGIWPLEPPPPLRIKPLTADPGPEIDPALSPDGNQVAYVKGPNLYVKLVDTGEPLLLSHGDEDCYAPAWSPDGRQIAFIRHLRGDDGEVRDGVFLVSALGGPERRVTASRVTEHGLAWAPDRETLALVERSAPGEPSRIVLLSLQSGERRTLTRPPEGDLGDTTPRFSPDGRMVAFVRSVAADETDVYIVSVDGAHERRLTVGNRQTEGLDWSSDGRSIVFSSWRQGGFGELSLWRVPIAGGSPEPLEFGEHGHWPTISRRGGRLAYAQGIPGMDIWRVAGPASPKERPPATRLISSTRTDSHARYSPDGTQIVFASQRSGAEEIWLCDRDGSNQRRLTFLDASMTTSPKWSPDGQHIAFTSTGEGPWSIYVVSVTGGVPRRLTTGPSRDLAFSWSRDGHWIYFCSNRTGRFEVWKVSPGGGDTIQVTTRGGTVAFESPDGRSLYYGKGRLGETRPGIWRIPREGGVEVKVLDRAGDAPWTLLDEGILHVADRSGSRLELVDLATGEVTWAASLEVPVVAPTLSASPDGRYVVYTGADRSEVDIMLVDGFE